MSYHVDVIPNRNSPPAILFRQAKREGKRIRRTTLANLSKLPPEIVDGIRALLKGGQVVHPLDDTFSIRRALPHGHVAALLGLGRQLGLGRLLYRKRGRMRDLALAAILSRVLDPASKLATARNLSPQTVTTSLGPLLGLGPVHGNEMLSMLDWLVRRQVWIEKSLARRHLEGRTLLLYDVSSSYLEGRCCPLAAFGHNRDGKKGKLQIVFGLLCAEDGCPLAVEVFSGNTGDPKTVAQQVKKIQGRFGIESIALVGDRGMLTTARLREDLSPAGLAWISALRTDAIRKLMRPSQSGTEGEQPAPLRPGELVPDRVAEILSPEFPGERLLVCLNPRLREDRARKREELLKATEEILETIASAVRSPRSRLRGQQAINRRVGRDVNRKKVAKHFRIEVTDDDIRWSRRQEKDRRGGPTGWHLHRSHQPERLRDRGLGGGGGVQESLPGGTGVSLTQDGAAGPAPRLRLQRGPCARACLSVSAGVLPGVAPAASPGAPVVRGGGSGRGASATEIPGGKSAGLRAHEVQGRAQADGGRAPGTEPPVVAGGSRHAHPEPGDPSERPAASVCDVYAKPTPVQAKAFESARRGSDPICCQ